MTTPESASTADNPRLSAQEIGKRFLKLLEGLTSREDLSLERIEEVTGIALPYVEAGGRYAYSEALENGWYYSLWYVPKSVSLQNGISLNFSKPTERFGDMSAVCALDFDYYRSALKTMGYEESPIPGEIGQIDEWRYYRGDITLSIIPQNVVAGEAGRLCVRSISTLN